MLPARLPQKWWTPFLLAGALFESCSHKLAPEGHFQSTPVIADGRADDWSLPLRFSDETYFSVGIVLNSVPATPVQQAGNGPARRSPNFGIRGMGNMGMRGGGRGGSYGRSTGIKEEDNWYQFRLTAK